MSETTPQWHPPATRDWGKDPAGQKTGDQGASRYSGTCLQSAPSHGMSQHGEGKPWLEVRDPQIFRQQVQEFNVRLVPGAAQSVYNRAVQRLGSRFHKFQEGLGIAGWTIIRGWHPENMVPASLSAQPIRSRMAHWRKTSPVRIFSKS